MHDTAALPMQFSATSVVRGASQLQGHACLFPRSGVLTVWRTRLRYDTRYTPPSRAPSRDRLAFYVVLEGAFQPSTEPVAVEGPSLWRLEEDVIEGALGQRPWHVWTGGERVSLVSVFLPRECVHDAPPLPTPTTRLPLPQSLLDDVRQYAQRVRPGSASSGWRPAVVDLLASLQRHGLVRSIPEPDPTLRRGLNGRLWDGLGRFMEEFNLKPSLSHLATLAKISPRHADRALDGWMQQYALPHETWRELTRRWRLKTAVLWLSSDDCTVTDVSQLAGYKNATALANALADEGLPPPSKLRELLRRS